MDVSDCMKLAEESWNEEYGNEPEVRSKSEQDCEIWKLIYMAGFMAGREAELMEQLKV